MGRRFKRERTYVYLWLTHVVIWQKPTHYCKAIILQLKIKLKKEEYKKNKCFLNTKKKKNGIANVPTEVIQGNT